jgi:hypothetical protein
MDHTYEPFEKDWIYPTLEDRTIVWRLSKSTTTFINVASFTCDEMRVRFDNAVKRLGNQLGDNPLVALSGGVDSQAACLALKRNGVPFTAAILRFKDDLNQHDVTSALNFCALNAVPFIVHEVDIMRFLSRDRMEFVERYECPSPQFATHFYFYEMLIMENNATSIICGGNPPCLRDEKWEFISTRSQSAWMTFAKLNKFPIFGNFLSYSRDIAIPFMLQQPNMRTINKEKIDWYGCKLKGMWLNGLDVIPQEQKFNGFELVKKQIESQTHDAWMFEKLYRHPNHGKYPEYGSELRLSPSVERRLTKLNNQFSLLNK